MDPVEGSIARRFHPRIVADGAEFCSEVPPVASHEQDFDCTVISVISGELPGGINRVLTDQQERLWVRR